MSLDKKQIEQPIEDLGGAYVYEVREDGWCYSKVLRTYTNWKDAANYLKTISETDDVKKYLECSRNSTHDTGSIWEQGFWNYDITAVPLEQYISISAADEIYEQKLEIMSLKRKIRKVQSEKMEECLKTYSKEIHEKVSTQIKEDIVQYINQLEFKSEEGNNEK